MKNFLKKLLCLNICLTLGYIGVEAATVKVNNSSSAAGVSGKSVTVELADADLTEYNKVDFKLSVSDSNLTIDRFSPATGNSLSYTSSGETYTFTATGTLANGMSLGKILFNTSTSMNSNIVITPVEVKFYKEDGTVVSTDTSTVKAIGGTVKYEAPKSNNASLTLLSVSQGTLSPEFNADTTNYLVTVADTINTIRITSTTASGATKTGATGTQALNLGENKFEIVVTAEDGTTTKTYTIIVNRGEETKPSAYLSELYFTDADMVLSPEFDKLNNKYSVNVASDIDNLKIKYTTEDAGANVVIEGNKDFILGENKVTITVKSSDESETQVYEIIVNKGDEESTDTTITVEKNGKKPKVWVIILIVIIIIALISGVAFILFKKKGKTIKKNKSNKKVETKDTELGSGEGVTEILEKELFTDEETTTYDKDELIGKLKLTDDDEDDSDEIEKTKEFNFRDFK